MTNAFFEKYQYKIKSVSELREILGPFPRQKKVVMCHGVFDVVHPGHVHHLAYAKSKADCLVVSITGDRHITKGIYRPHVPERLRALNLAAFEMVDYVLIDQEAKPLANIALLQPDLFAKGFEYVSGGLAAKTAEESNVLQVYGGELIFTPGDVVYSSSHLIEMAAPNIKQEKLLLLMHENGITFETLRQTVTSLQGFRVHVVGDTIVDSQTQTTLIGGQTKTPTFSVLYENCIHFVGGAGVVCKHLRAAGADTVFSTVLGNDELKDFVLEDLKVAGVDCRHVVDNSRPTVNKNAIVCNDYRLLKIDRLDNRQISEQIVVKLEDTLRETACDAVVFSDFRHGIFNRDTVVRLTAAIPGNVFRVADSQVASRWGNIAEFLDFDLITPNEREARFVLADQDSGVGPLAGELLKKTRCKTIMLKLGPRGVFTLCSERLNRPSQFFSMDSFVGHVVDAVGAGDALLAYATLSMLKTGSEVIATILGTMAAACECEVDGNIPVKPEDILAKLNKLEESC
ncbi:MAG: D-glycero-D-manno-heptose-1-phosphate adenylyltransferase [Magnetococcales bacterium]|nr:D-glycero-D-manno-heptose-1-phosphate adenylyltransferase [Magnetococcales bacterium]HIJ83249.1 adenylyltransferase/cytidyltransferase family protein [Magnetococcales bacterium]